MTRKDQDAPVIQDEILEGRLEALRSAIGKWAAGIEPEETLTFKSYRDHSGDEPGEIPVVLYLIVDECFLVHVFNDDGSWEEAGRLWDEFNAIVKEHRFVWDLRDAATVSFYPTEEEAPRWGEYFRFQWVLDMVRPGFIDVSGEFIAFFRDRPDYLRNAGPRQVEVFLDSVFRNNGFRTELGPGSNDGGVDLRLYNHDVVGEIQTLVQIRRYAEKYPIELEAVAALAAIVDQEKAHRGLFITTSRYLPVAQRFAARKQVLELATLDHIKAWCTTAAANTSREKDFAFAEQLLAEHRSGVQREGMVGTIVHSLRGYRALYNKYAVVVRDTPHASLLAPIKSKVVSGDIQQGFEAPDFVLNDSPFDSRLIVARKRESHDRLSLWGGGQLFHVWDGKPNDFCGD